MEKDLSSAIRRKLHSRVLMLIPEAERSRVEDLAEVLSEFTVEWVADLTACGELSGDQTGSVLIIDEDILQETSALTTFREQQGKVPILVICHPSHVSRWDALIPDTLDEYIEKPWQVRRMARFIKVLEQKYTSRIYHAELDDSERSFQMLFENTSDGFMMVDESGKICAYNRMAEKIIGHKVRELIGKAIWEFQFDLLPNDQQTEERAEHIRELFSDALLNGKRHWPKDGQEVHFKHPDGSVHTARQTVKILATRKGFRLVSIIEDLTQAKLQQQRTHEYLNMLHESQQAAQMGSFNYFCKTDSCTCSDALFELLNLPRDNSRTLDSWLQLVVPKDRPVVEKYFRDFKQQPAQEISLQYEMMPLNASQPIWVQHIIKTLTDEQGQVSEFRSTIQNITEQVFRERELRKYMFALQQSPALVLITDIDGHIEYVNAKFMEVTGYSLKEVLGRKPSFLKSGKTSQDTYKNLWDTILAGGTWQGEFQNRRKNGELYWEWSVISPILDEEGKIFKLLGVKEDITARKMADKHDRILKEQLLRAQRMEAIGTMASGIAHDFNNILQSMYLYLGMAMDSEISDQVRGDLTQVVEATQRARVLVAQIVQFSRHTELGKKKVMIQYIVKETLKYLQNSFPDTVRIHADIDVSCQPVMCDPTHIHQILTNLVNNAYDSLDKGRGNIRVSLHQTELKPLADQEIKLPEGTYLKLVVADSGHGMSPDVQEHIFNPFFSTRAPGRGSGLGLSVVHGIVTELQGQILVKSKPGKGSAFTIMLPVVKEESETGEAEDSLTSLDLSSLSVLHLDANITVRSGIRQRLEANDCHVVSCEHATELRETLQRYPETFGLVIIDYHVKGEFLYQLLAEIKSIRPDLPVLLTLSSDKSPTSDLTQAGLIDGILTKPWQAHDLLRMIIRLVPGLLRHNREDAL